MPITATHRPSSRFVTLVTVVIVVAVLRVTQEITIPLAIALLLAFLLSPLVVRLTRWHLPKTLAITVTVAIAFTLLAITGWHISNQAVALLEDIPNYEANLHTKIAALKKPETSGALARALGTLEKMQADLFAPWAEARPGSKEAPRAPVPVEVKATNRSSLRLAGEVAVGLFRPLGTAGIILVFVVAILFQRDDLRHRFIRAVGGDHLNLATQAVDDAAQRVSRYLVAQLMVNACFGLCIGLGLAVIGVPHAPVWGLLSTLLRFIPFLGALIAASFPLVLAVAVDPGWTMLFWTLGLFVAAEVVTSNLVEVWIYGTRTGVSTLALLTAAVFWSWLWGLAGLFLSTPLTVCLLVIGQYVPGLKFLGVLLGSEPPPDPATQFYQRMLSMNQEEMYDAAETHVEQRSLAEFYDDVFVPALLMAEVDRHNGALAEVRQKFIIEASRELLDELRERHPPAGETPPAIAAGAPSPVVLCLPARDEADELVAQMLAQLLREIGVTVTVVSATSSQDSYLSDLKNRDAIVVVSALPPSTLSAAGRASRRVKQAGPGAKVVVGVWHAETGMENLQRRLDSAGVDAIATRLADVVLQVRRMIEEPSTAHVPAAETTSTRALERTETELAEAKPADATDTVTRELARSFNVPLSLVCVVKTDPAYWRSPTPPTASGPSAESAVHADALKSDSLLVVGDVSKDARFSANPTLVQRGVRFFASAPLRARGGHLVGNLCVLDTHPRTFSDADAELIQALATQLTEALDADSTPLTTSTAPDCD